MSLTLKNSIIRGTQADIKNEVTINIVENYDHEKYSKPQIIWCDLPCVIFENKDLKDYFDNLLSESGITYREQGMIISGKKVMRISMRIPAHFYSDKPIPKKRTKKKKLVEEVVEETVDTSTEDTTTKE